MYILGTIRAVPHVGKMVVERAQECTRPCQWQCCGKSSGIACLLVAVASLLLVCTSWDVIKQSLPGALLTLSDERRSPLSGVTGRLFRGDRVRIFDGARFFGTQFEPSTERVSATGFMATKWAVCTTIHPPSEAITRLANLSGWALVVVGDEGTPAFPHLGSRAVFLDVPTQQRMAANFPAFFQLLPWRHFGRKNVGYLYAILHGAEQVWDFDDDNPLKPGELPQIPPLQTVMTPQVEVGCATFNPYPHMGAPVAEVEAWPRGYPMNLIRSPCVHTLEPAADAVVRNVSVWQSLADNEPDVDGIFRLTRITPFSFATTASRSITIPAGVLAPYNAQATLLLQPALWSLLLPVTVHGRVSDIWRSYIAQRLLWDVGSYIAFTPPRVDQFRNPHNPLADMQAEEDLYYKSLALVQRLREWRGSGRSLESRYEELSIDLYERGYLQVGDVLLAQQWIRSLRDVGYVFPQVLQ